MAKVYDKPINKHIPWDGNNQTDNHPVKGTRIEEFLKIQLQGRIGVLYYDQQSNKQLAFADEENRDLYLENPVDNAHLLLGAFDAPANYTAEISLMSSPAVSVLKEQKGNYIEFTFDIKNKSGASVGDSVICTYTFISFGKKVEAREVYTAGQSVRFLVDDYLVEGINTINISIVGRTTMAATMVGVTYNVVDLTINTDFDFATAKQTTDTLEVPYVVKGTGVKYMEFYVDGVKYGEDDTITDAVGTRTKYIDIADLSSGRHHLQMRAYVISSGQKFYSPVVYRDFVIAGYGIVTVLIATTLADLVGDRLTLKGSQYSSISFDFGLYDSRQRILDVVFAANGTEISTISTSNGTVNTFSYALDTVGETVITATCEDTTYEVSVEVTKSNIDIEEPTEGLVMKLSAKGRSNSENNRGRWTDRGYTATLNNFAYTEKQGWHNDALVISGGATVDVDIAPLASNWATTGGTIVFDIETADVEDAEAVLCECVDDNTSAGFIVKPNETSMQSSGGAKVKTNYREHERHQIAIIVNKTSGVENAKTILIVNDGKCERAINFSDTDSFVCPKNLSIGDPNGKVTLKVYSIQVFNRALTVDDAFNSWALDSSDTQAIVQRNDIYVEGTKVVSPDKIVSRVPVMIITGDMPKIIAARDKKTSIYADVEYINNQDPTKNFTALMMKFYRQGTSSLGYDIPNLNGKADENSTLYDYEGKKIEAYSFKDKAQPVRLWCWKADYAESSGSHNTGIARLWNKVMYNTKLDSKYLNEGEDPYVLRTNAQRAAIQANYPYDVRTTIDGFPIVLFYRLDKNSELVCMGQYNFNNDKKTESVFGFVDIPGFDNSNVECWEGLNNTHPIALYTDVSNFDSDWEDAFEARYPDGSTKVDNLKVFAVWVNSTKGNVEKFSTEKYEHLDVWKVAAYYIYLMRFGAVDQPVKNSMTTTEDGKHYFFINYDNDTIDGKRNDGPLVYGPFITRQSIDEELNDYAYAGHESVLWNNLEADADFMNKVRIIDNAMYEAGLSYDGVIEEFDTNQVDKWCEKLCNLNGDYKYLKPFREKGNNYLKLLQGDLKSHRHWWLSNRFEMFNAMWVSGTYKSKFIEFKAAGAKGPSEGVLPQGFTIMAGKDLQYGYGINNDPIQYNKELAIGESHRFTFKRDLAVGDPVRIYAANSIRELHLEEIADTLVQLKVESAFDELLGTRLKGIYLNASDSNLENNAVSDISGLPLVTALETLIIRGFKAIKSLNLSTLKNLHVFNATNSGLTSFVPATGVNLASVDLPSAIQAIRLDKANVNKLWYIPGTTLREVVMKNVTGMDVKSFVLGWHNSLSSAETDLLSTASLTLEGINWTGMTAADVLKLADFGYHSLKGTIELSSVTQEEINTLSAVFGSNVFQPSGEFYLKAPDGVFIAGADSVIEGDTLQLTAEVFSSNPGKVEWSIIGEQASVAIDPNGLLSTTETGVPLCVTVQAKHIPPGGTIVTSTKAVNVLKAIHITGGEIIGDNTVSSTHAYTLSALPKDANRPYQVVWALSGEGADNGYVTLDSIDGENECVVSLVDSTGAGNATLKATATSSNGSQVVIEKQLMIGTELTIRIKSNQDDDAVIAALKATVSYGDVTLEVSDGETVGVPSASAVTITFPTVEKYKSPEAIEIATGYDPQEVTGTYYTEIVSVMLATWDDASCIGQSIILNGVSHTWDGTTALSAQFAYDEEYTLTASDLAGYDTPMEQIVASKPQRAIVLTYKAQVGSWITIDQTISDPATMISGDVNGTHIQAIRNNSHRYLGKYTAEGTMTVCQLDDSDSNYYRDGSAAVLTGTEGDVFMKLPRFWYRAKEEMTDVWQIGFYYGSESPGAGWVKWDTNALIGVYEAYSTGSKVYSRSGVTSSGNISQANFKAYARNRGNGFRIVDWQMHCVMAILFYAQYGHTKCQEKIGAGTSSSSKQCGQTNANGMNDTKGTSPVSGLNDAGVDGNTQSINFWGLENWWGNKYEWIDNVVVDAYEWKITEPDGTVRTPGKTGSSSNYITKMMFGDNCDLIPTAASGSETTGFCDYYYGSSSTARVVLRSYYNADTLGGVAFVGAYVDSSYAYSYFGSRLAFRGDVIEETNVETFKSLTAIG